MIKQIFREVPGEDCDFSVYFDDDGLKEAGGDFCYTLFIVPMSYRGSGFNLCAYEKIQDEIGEKFDAYDECNVTDEYKPYQKLFARYDRDADAGFVADYLTIKTGKVWDTYTACGACQGDVAEIVYCRDHYTNGVANYGDAWFGCGKEFDCITLDDDGNECDTCSGFIVTDSKIKKWSDCDAEYKRILCEYYGCKPEETIVEFIE